MKLTMKRRLILHLGLWKTGTTTIQRFLRDNPGPLAAAGIHYPKVLPANPDHPLLKSNPVNPWIGNEINHLALGNEIRKRKRRIADAPVALPLWSTAFRGFDESGAQAAIISYEDFSARIESYDFALLSSWMRKYDVLGLIYLRHQESWATSLYAHMVRALTRPLSFEEFMSTIKDRLAYSHLLDAIREEIPLDKLVVGAFEEAAASGLLEDFIERAGLPRELLATAENYSIVNRSLPDWAVLFLQQCLLAGMRNSDLVEVRAALGGRDAKRSGTMLKPGLNVATPDQRKALRDAAGADTKRLQARYGIGLTTPRQQTTPYRPFDGDDFVAIRDTIAPTLSPAAKQALASL